MPACISLLVSTKCFSAHLFPAVGLSWLLLKVRVSSGMKTRWQFARDWCNYWPHPADGLNEAQQGPSSNPPPVEIGPHMTVEERRRALCWPLPVSGVEFFSEAMLYLTDVNTHMFISYLLVKVVPSANKDFFPCSVHFRLCSSAVCNYIPISAECSPYCELHCRYVV